MSLETDLIGHLAYRAELRDRAGLRRRLEPRSTENALIDLAGNDYLGLSRHPSVIAAAVTAMDRYGLGATSSRVVHGSTMEHEALERELAEALGQPAALVYSSGYLANLGAIRAVARPSTRLFIDAHSHASLFDGCRLAGVETQVMPHLDLAALDQALAGKAGDAVVVTESVFSVDGDAAPLRELLTVCQARDAVLLVDDAHAFGVLDQSDGAASLAGEPNVVVTATLSKALGAAGGVLAGDPTVIRHVVDTGRTFVYDTGLPPAVAAGARAALELAATADGERKLLRSRAGELAVALSAAGFEVVAPAAGIVSARAPSAAEAVAWAARCRAKGVVVGCFRPPSTPDNSSRLRLTINAALSDGDFRRARDAVIATAPS